MKTISLAWLGVAHSRECIDVALLHFKSSYFWSAVETCNFCTQHPSTADVCLPPSGTPTKRDEQLSSMKLRTASVQASLRSLGRFGRASGVLAVTQYLLVETRMLSGRGVLVRGMSAAWAFCRASRLLVLTDPCKFPCLNAPTGFWKRGFSFRTFFSPAENLESLHHLCFHVVSPDDLQQRRRYARHLSDWFYPL